MEDNFSQHNTKIGKVYHRASNLMDGQHLDKCIWQTLVEFCSREREVDCNIEWTVEVANGLDQLHLDRSPNLQVRSDVCKNLSVSTSQVYPNCWSQSLWTICDIVEV